MPEPNRHLTLLSGPLHDLDAAIGQLADRTTPRERRAACSNVGQMRHLATLGMLLVASTASAQPGVTDEPAPPPATPTPEVRTDRGYVAGGVLLGADHFIHGALTLEAGVRLGDAPVWLHVAGAKGSSMDFEGGGDFLRGLAGIETRSCIVLGACFVLGVDAGTQRATWSGDDFDDEEHHRGTVLAARIGIDAGGDRVRFRGGMEVLRVHNSSNVTETEWTGGIGFTLGLAYRL